MEPAKAANDDEDDMPSVPAKLILMHLPHTLCSASTAHCKLSKIFCP